MKCRTIDDALTFIDSLLEDSLRRLQTDMLSHGVDPDDVDAVVAQQRAEFPAWRSQARRDIEAFGRDFSREKP